MGPTHSRYLQWVELIVDDQTYTVVNVHGLWNGAGKTDTSERIAQSQNIKKFVDTINHKKIICGDFNLRPDTTSFEIISEGLNDQIQINNIISTRSKYYEKYEKFADYIFTSPDLSVNDFKVWPDEISDHLPLFLDFQ